MKQILLITLIPLLLTAFVTLPGAEEPPLVVTASMAPGSEEATPVLSTSAIPAISTPTSEAEYQLSLGLDKLLAQKMDEAESIFFQLQEKYPDFRLANLIYSDILRARSGPVRRFGGQPQTRLEKAQVQEVLDEARTRAKYLTQNRPSEGNIPEPLLHISPTYAHIILVDMSRSRLYTFQNDGGIPRLINDYYISIGRNGAGKEVEGDKKTPIGLYFITGRLPGDQLPAYYGSGALPLNYPNEWDQLHRKTGSGIWLHGTPIYTYSRPPKSSEGCVALTNPDFEALQQTVGVGTPVLISKSINWLDQTTWHTRRQTILAELEKWRQDWQSRDPERTLNHYARDFHTLESDLATWSQSIRERFASEPTASMTVANINVFGYPSEEPMLLVTFTQQGADHPDQRAMRRQYWRQERGNATWKIVYEDEG